MPPIPEHPTPLKPNVSETSTTRTMASILPSPLLSALRPVITFNHSTAALPTASSSECNKDAQVLSPPGSPPTASATSTPKAIAFPQATAAEPVASRRPPSRDTTTLKRDLHIDAWQCGAQTREGTSCKRGIRYDKRCLIEAQLASMSGLTRASPDFESTVLELVKLVHCRWHVAGGAKEHRLETWELAFPPGVAEDSERGMSVERFIKALKPLRATCIGHENGGVCEDRIGGWQVQNCDKTIEELIKQETYFDDAKFGFLLKVLEWNRTCIIHQSFQQYTRAAEWKNSIVAILPTRRNADILASSASREPRIAPRTRSDLTIQDFSGPRASTGPTIRPYADPALYWPKAYDSSRFEIILPTDSDASPLRSLSLDLVRKVIRKPLSAPDYDDGYVYAYKVEGNEGYVKIGYTGRTLDERHDEWSFDCNRLVQPVYPPTAQATNVVANANGVAAMPSALIPHARRVEALCHAEFDHRRIKIYCRACRKQHIEWFEVSATEVTAVIQKWSRWMSTQPYELLQLRSIAKWTLKANEVRRISKIGDFMREIE